MNMGCWEYILKIIFYESYSSMLGIVKLTKEDDGEDGDARVLEEGVVEDAGEPGGDGGHIDDGVEQPGEGH